MAYDALRNGLFVAANSTVKIYRVLFNNCFGTQIGQFCLGCNVSNDPSECTNCYGGFSNTGFPGACTYSKAGELFAPKIDAAVVCDTCYNTIKFNYSLNRCACP